MYDIPVYLSWRKSIASNFYIPPTIPVLLEDSHFSWAHVMAHEAEEVAFITNTQSEPQLLFDPRR